MGARRAPIMPQIKIERQGLTLSRSRYIYMLVLPIALPFMVVPAIKLLTQWFGFWGGYEFQTISMMVFATCALIAARMLSIDIGLSAQSFRGDNLIKAACILSFFLILSFCGIFIISGKPFVIYSGGDLLGNKNLAMWYVLHATIEEIAFRGILLTALVPFFGRWIGLILQALCFALLHETQWLSPHFLWHMYMGVAFGIITLSSKSLIPAILIHISWNLLMAVCTGMTDVVKPGSFGLILNVDASSVSHVIALGSVTLTTVCVLSVYLCNIGLRKSVAAYRRKYSHTY